MCFANEKCFRVGLTGAHYTYTSSQQREGEELGSGAVAQPVGAGAASLWAESGDTQADLSTSSLRRKLFFHGDEGTPLSPVR